MRLLLIRFSAFGDVILLLSVIASLKRQNPQIQIDLLTRSKFAQLYEGMEGINVIGVDIDKEYNGLSGIWKLYRKIGFNNYDYIIDAHEHLRTKLLRSFSIFDNKPWLSIKKPRRLRKSFIKKGGNEDLPHMTEIYFAPFKKIGLSCELVQPPYVRFSNTEEANVKKFLYEQGVERKNGNWVGLAPFAFHPTKEWGMEKVSHLIKLYKELQPETMLFLFGGGQSEIDKLKRLKTLAPTQIVVVAGHLKLREEWALIHRLDGMLCMDSANMHLAATAGVPIVSIWGATSPKAGFSPIFQDPSHAIQTEDLQCKPCSIYGNKPCMRGDMACMERVTTKQVYVKISQLTQREDTKSSDTRN
ncbi:MAG: glycosyltransferase family 9 protein [Cyclobacteriaceae bacterium]|nr:glycosyltransferase family 9 protein [Cyclobacteriaceae bacterium]MCH8516374.1 glycosyltransferase family 9 protein [Cyclobacteriaceae bacterium]